MTGVTPHGIRYPDGASRAKNLGPELQQMAEDIDGYVDSRIENIVIDENMIRAYPEGVVAQTGLTELPAYWEYKVLNSPVTATVTATVEGTWTNGGKRRGNVPVLNNQGKLAEAQIPTAYPTLAQVNDRIAAAIESIEPDDTAAVPDRPTSWWARIIKQRRASQPSALAIAASSTGWYNPGFVGLLAPRLQATLYPEGTPTPVQWSETADFTLQTAPGLHVYNASQGGVRSVNYLTEEEMDKIAALSPACLIHMPVANDYTEQISPNAVRDALLQKRAYLNSVLDGPCQHIYVHSYARRNFTPPTYQHSIYGTVMREVAHSDPMGVYLDLSPAYRPLGVPGPDPLALIGPDFIHQTADGYAYMDELFYKFCTT